MYRALGPLRSFLSDIPWPFDAVPLPTLAGDLLDRLFVLNTSLDVLPRGYVLRAAVAWEDELVFGIPGLDIVTLAVGGEVAALADLELPVTNAVDVDEATLGGDAPVRFVEEPVAAPEGYTAAVVSLELSEAHNLLTVHDIAISIRFAPAVLKPVALLPDDEVPTYASITVRGSMDIDASLNVGVHGFDEVSLSPAMIGSSGVIIAAEGVEFSLLQSNPEIRMQRATVLLPQDLFPAELFPALPQLILSDGRIDARGFSGSIAADWPLEFDAEAGAYQYRLPQRNPDGSFVTGPGGDVVEEIREATLFGLPGGIRHVGLCLEQNQLTGCDITGALIIPYFDEPVEVRFIIKPDGKFDITLLGVDENGITLTKEELIALNLKSLTISAGSGPAAVVLSGGLQPLLMASDGLQWPRLDVTDLSIDSTGRFHITEAWLDLKDLVTLDLWGFQFELNRIGVGHQEADDKLWVDLSGSLRLIEQIPVGLGVEGFRLTWPRLLFEQLNIDDTPTFDEVLAIAGKLEVEFEGVYLFFGVPDAVEFEGLIRFIKRPQVVGFAGDMALRVPASGFAAEAGLLIGMNLEAPPLGPYPFLYVYFGVELPAGIPLGQSGLALKGAQGMFGLNVKPAKTEEENWYYDWYKRGPIVGAQPTNKWTNMRDALALGVGVTITTADGYVKGTRGLLVLAIPGPILIIEGRALVLNGLQPNAEPPLRALAVFDGVAGIAQFNVEAEATLIEDTLEAYGMLEAFFDFNDITNWHLYLGQDEPRDHRIRASVLKFNEAFLFQADAYLMIDMVGAATLRSRMGAFIGFAPPVPDIGPLKVEFDATLEGDGVVTVRPEQFSGDIVLSVNIGLSMIGFSARLSASAGVLTEGPKPFKVGANVHVECELPWPLDPAEGDVEFVWEAPTVPPVESPLSGISVNSRFAPSGGGFSADAPEANHRIHDEPIAALRAQWEDLTNASPVVPVDAQPIIAFRQQMNSEFFARHPDGTAKHYDLGPMRFTPALTEVRLYEHGKDNPTWNATDSDWTLIGSSDETDDKPLPGVWLAESDPQSPDGPSPRRAQLWTDNPLIHTGRALGAGNRQFLGAFRPGKPLAGRILSDYPDLMQCLYSEPERVCVDFVGADGVIVERAEAWSYRGLRFEVSSGEARVRTVIETSAGAAVGTARDPVVSGMIAAVRVLIDAVRQWLPGHHPLWDRLLGRRTTQTCLQTDGYLHVRFPEGVRKVWITLCEPVKIPQADIPVRLHAKRQARDAAELREVRVTARRGKPGPDPDACIKDVRARFTISDRLWIIEADEAFRCLDIVRMSRFGIEEICYLTAEEHERAERAKDQCEANRNPPGDPQTLRTGAYYRLDVTTTVDAQSLQNLGEPYASIVNLFTSGQNQLPKTFEQRIFFQTEGPPGNLRPYVKWTSPAHQAQRLFRQDDVAIRFLRTNLKPMFADPYRLQVQVVDAQRKRVPNYVTRWLKAHSATIFAEEQVWQSYRDSSLNWPPAPVGNDDILLARPKWRTGEGLAPNARYEVRVVHPDHDDKPLFSSSFTTSAFLSFADLIGSYPATAVLVPASADYRYDAGTIESLAGLIRESARAEWEWQQAEVQYRFEVLEGGREALEQAKLKRRNARAAHNASFQALALSLAGVYFEPFSDNLELYLVTGPAGRPVGLWLRSPESLDLQLPVLTTPRDEAGHPADFVGRTQLVLKRQGSIVPLSAVVVANADSTQVLILPPSDTAWTNGLHDLEFTYYRDFGDEDRDINHRYDRPKEFRNGSSVVQVQTLHFVI